MIAIPVESHQAPSATVGVMTHGFVHWTLRTLDLDRARGFYGDLLDDGVPDVAVLPAAAHARGARPHWLGHLATADVATTTAAFVARGAIPLGGGALLRDPGGAILALTPPRPPSRRDVVWQQLLTPDPARAQADYGALSAMTLHGQRELPPHGVFTTFAWADGPPVGSIGDTTGRPHLHPQWLFYFRATDLDHTVARIRARGGAVLDITTLPDGRRATACEDDQGGAFAIMSP